MDKRFWATVGVIVILFVGFLVVKNNDKASAPTTSVKPTTNVRGKQDSKVTLIEYGDFQCPACGQYYPVVEQVYTKYADTVKFQFRNFPLTSLHPNAFAGSRAAEAAGKQGKFWDMYNKLYTNQTEWSGGSNPVKFFDTYAKDIGLNVTKFDADFKSKAVNDLVQADIDAGNALGASATPTFVLNGTKIENPAPTVDAFSKVLDNALKKS